MLSKRISLVWDVPSCYYNFKFSLVFSRNPKIDCVFSRWMFRFNFYNSRTIAPASFYPLHSREEIAIERFSLRIFKIICFHANLFLHSRLMQTRSIRQRACTEHQSWRNIIWRLPETRFIARDSYVMMCNGSCWKLHSICGNWDKFAVHRAQIFSKTPSTLWETWKCSDSRRAEWKRRIITWAIHK